MDSEALSSTRRLNGPKTRTLQKWNRLHREKASRLSPTYAILRWSRGDDPAFAAPWEAEAALRHGHGS